MSQLPVHKFRCPNCNGTLRSRYREARCSNDGCDWQGMNPVPCDDMTMRPYQREPSFLEPLLIAIGSIVGFFFLASYLLEAYFRSLV